MNFSLKGMGSTLSMWVFMIYKTLNLFLHFVENVGIYRGGKRGIVGSRKEAKMWGHSHIRE